MFAYPNDFQWDSRPPLMISIVNLQNQLFFFTNNTWIAINHIVVIYIFVVVVNFNVKKYLPSQPEKIEIPISETFVHQGVQWISKK